MTPRPPASHRPAPALRFASAGSPVPPPALAALLVLAAGWLGPLAAQVDTTATPVDSVLVSPRAPLTVVPGADTTPTLPMSPRGAFIRSMILPGWGQSAFDSHFRGGVFFAGWAANWFMNFRNYTRLDEARDRRALRKAQLADSIISAGLPRDHPGDAVIRGLAGVPDLLDAAQAADSIYDDLDDLVDARKQQREDWIAWSVFWILASGVDGYVTAHLYDFPASIDLEPAQDGGVSLRLEVPLGRRRP